MGNLASKPRKHKRKNKITVAQSRVSDFDDLATQAENIVKNEGDNSEESLASTSRESKIIAKIHQFETDEQKIEENTSTLGAPYIPPNTIKSQFKTSEQNLQSFVNSLLRF